MQCGKVRSFETALVRIIWQCIGTNRALYSISHMPCTSTLSGTALMSQRPGTGIDNTNKSGRGLEAVTFQCALLKNQSTSRRALKGISETFPSANKEQATNPLHSAVQFCRVTLQSKGFNFWPWRELVHTDDVHLVNRAPDWWKHAVVWKHWEWVCCVVLWWRRSRWFAAPPGGSRHNCTPEPPGSCSDSQLLQIISKQFRWY